MSDTTFTAPETLDFIDLNIGVCGLVYGTAPCTAAGDSKCFNTRATCQDTFNFDVEDEPGGVAEYVTTLSNNAPSGATVTFTDVAVPGGGAIALTVSARRAAGGSDIVSATIGGEAAEVVVQRGSGGTRAAILFAEGPFGAEIDISITFANQLDWLRVGVWNTEDGRPVAGTAASSITTPSQTVVVDAAKEGSILAVVTSYLQSSTAWTGLDEEVDGSQSSGNYSFAGRGFTAEDLAHAVTATQTHADRSAPTFVATGTGMSGSGYAINDIVIVAIETQGGWSPATLTPNWNHVGGAPVTDGVTGDLNVIWQRLTGTTFTLDDLDEFPGDHISWNWIVVRGVEAVGDAIAAFASGQSAGAVTGITIPSVTTTRVNSLIVDIAMWTQDNAGPRYSGWTNANLTGMTERADSGTTSGGGGGTAINTGVKGAVGATGTTAATCAASNQQFYMKIALNPDQSSSRAAMAAAAFEWTRPARNSEVTLRFTKASTYRPLGIEAIPNIASVDYTPATIAPGEDLGTRAQLRVTFKDGPHSDTGDGFDPYYAERPYDPYRQGTFWGKFRARQPYLKGELVTWRQGYLGQDIGEMTARTFVVESFDGPTPDGRYTLIAYDPIKLLDGDRAQCPGISQGRVSIAIDSDDTSLTLTPSGIGEEYPASGHVAIGGKEIVAFTRSADVLTITRAQMNTEATSHDAQDRVQLVKSFDSMDPADILAELLVDYASVPAEWIPLAEWQSETGAYLRRNFSTDIAEPVGVQQLVAELMQHCGLSLWWDDRAMLFRLRVLRAIATDAASFDETLFRKDTISIKEQPDKRVSQVWVSFGQINPLKSIDDTDNYRSTVIAINAESEAFFGQSKIRKIQSRWISQGGRSAAERVAQLLLNRYAVPPRLISFGLFRDAQALLRLGDGCTVSHRVIQDATGARMALPAQAIRVKPGDEGDEIAVEEFNFATFDEEDLANRQVTIDADTFALNLRDLHDDLYPSPRAGDTVRFVILENVTVGGAPGEPAIDIGAWETEAATGNRTSGSAVISGLSIDTSLLAEGILVTGTGIPAGTRILSIDSASQITLTANATSGAATSTALTFYLVNLVIENLGTISGIGGVGGKGANENGDAGSGGKNGGAGGTALYARYFFTYIDEGALTQGGGGGGAGGSCANFDDHRGGGGGGGAGAPGGAGGDGPGNGENGQPGTLTTGGAYGRSYTSSTFWTGPSLKSNVHGGAGGTPGTAGADDVGGYDVSGGSPGAAGVCIDGISYLTQDGATGTRLGSQIN